jgi:hypothetical protein
VYLLFYSLTSSLFFFSTGRLLLNCFPFNNSHFLLIFFKELEQDYIIFDFNPTVSRASFPSLLGISLLHFVDGKVKHQRESKQEPNKDKI